MTSLPDDVHLDEVADADLDAVARLVRHENHDEAIDAGYLRWWYFAKPEAGCAFMVARRGWEVALFLDASEMNGQYAPPTGDREGRPYGQPYHPDVFAGRAMGARPGGWVGRGPAFTGEIGRVTASFTGKRISSP